MDVIFGLLIHSYLSDHTRTYVRTYAQIMDDNRCGTGHLIVQSTS